MSSPEAAPLVRKSGMEPPPARRRRNRRSPVVPPATGRITLVVDSSSASKWRVFESVHISAHVIYAVLTEKALNPFVECTSGLVGGEGLSITLKLGRKRSIKHIYGLAPVSWRVEGLGSGYLV
jgi:hypothetical protein